MNSKRETSVNAVNRGDPLWYKDAVIYQLHVKSFFDANNDGIGDFAGLLAKLDYIAELGVDTIWLLPFYPSPRRDDGYDIAEYRGVHPDYGELTDVRRFINAAHERGMRVITELVVNHTSDQHPWFQRARHAKPGSAARNFYVWSDNDQAYAGTRIIFLDTEKSNWTWDPVAGAYFWHRFYSHQPDLNYDNPRVLKAILSVMHFWLDLGVDGLRLDAVPYLVEREGTNNENLPETHAILRRIRQDLDASYDDRMLLAEANQWPEDAQEYFGQGDECHMSFHFPLMPRMYMAIAREDRFPITDIMHQTPDIPSNCQWAIFLRNHDELTLEMVTSSERDYLWEVYAADRRARLNLGIRRRLAPLMERDRRRIELMNSLLLTMPGTPVIYYGDEIGMGDNVHLGDRDGVRTPMQWSPDRNGGFSRADPERLVLPPLMGNLYGYEAVNVEAQAGDAHSLLNWTRRMLAKRRQYRVFGRGTLRFLYPGNRKILAYLREYEETTILCVANLSHTPQAVELDLAEFDGRVPVELMGGTSFPAIGRLTYLLTLPPYGFYWFELSTTATPPTWHLATADQLREFRTLVLRGKVGYDLMAESRRTLEQVVLPEYLSLRRWFASKNERILSGHVVYGVRLPAADELYLAEIEANLGERRERYVVPLGLIWEETLPPLQQQLALARVRRGPLVGMVTDAFSLQSFAVAVFDSLKSGLELESRNASDGGGAARIRFLPEPGLDAVTVTAETPIQWLSAEQSNSSLVLANEAVLKIVRRVTAGVHPEGEMTRYLTRLGFRNTAALLGEVVRVDEDGTPHTLMLVQQYVGNQGDAWNWTLEYLRRTLDDATFTDESAEDYGQELRGYAAFAAAMGKRLGELHAALAVPSDDPAFSPVEAHDQDVARWVEDARQSMDRAMAILADGRDWGDAAADVSMLLDNRHVLAAALARLGQGVKRARLTRVHGDFHLGQVLVAQNDAYIIDFEGEPARTMEERRRKSNPIRDVAGLLRSFDYAAAVARDMGTAAAGASPIAGPSIDTVAQRRDVLLERFRSEASHAFLDAYREVAAVAPHAWVDMEEAEALLLLFLVEKAAYEISYEAANRPNWISVPVRGLASLAARIEPSIRREEDPSIRREEDFDEHGQQS
ncbi:MAG: maltose alpha-D-glucosyltransferase [Pigmentiphaga sp.]|uniref:maltose alpha-D-glucosyltransferase n=1 Tax=Pigmentiphaga sp. TaxID=1977564 RepID=UPI0029B69765|nr:maltose alpha-D-glucosyltransferase [Pigmentiphaga sp.]MDX3907901.1 maltose alpha-D-glucosyltransferase [Pigmentiphaga sp.]